MARKKKFSITLFSLALILLSSTGCNNYDSPSEKVELNEKSSSSVMKSELNSTALKHGQLLKETLFATGSNLQSTRATTAEGENPIIEKLQSLNLEDEKGNRISFYDLTEVQQRKFMDDWIVLEADQLTEKIAIAPEVEQIILEENKIVEQTLEEESKTTRSGEKKVINNNNFFTKLQNRLTESKEFSDETKTRSANENLKEIDLDKFKSILNQKAKRGNFLVTLPKNGDASKLINFGSSMAVGHAAVIVKDAPYKYDGDALTVGAQMQYGVVNETIKYWAIEGYLMGLQQLVYKWRGWRGWGKEWQHFDDTSEVARYAESYKGKDYVRWYEFLTAKWAAPERFTCTTLVWFCAKKAYNISLTSWYTTMITPSALYTHENAYVKAEIK